MQKYELSAYDFEALSKLMRNAIGDGTKVEITSFDMAVIRSLKDKFEAGFSAYIETEQE